MIVVVCCMHRAAAGLMYHLHPQSRNKRVTAVARSFNVGRSIRKNSEKVEQPPTMVSKTHPSSWTRHTSSCPWMGNRCARYEAENL